MHFAFISIAQVWFYGVTILCGALELLTVFIKQPLRFRGADMMESVTKTDVINAQKRSSNFITQEVQNDV